MGKRPTGHNQQLKDIVEARRVRPPRGDNRQELLDVFAKQWAFERGFPGMHPIAVATDRVYFAVVRQEAKRLGRVPGRKGVCGVALMDERERALKPIIAQIRVVLGNLWGQ